ncbi:Mur ligase family protein [Caloranaerobacter ferrireducens]|uniref:Mur ligase family protein n=1 Tax=Caloranaerobacter ferrireducens TaxID=1323370 RepID=UPI00084D4E6F|nr:Mur ligase family protein [Caloranaerobacter ferrireducens]
MTTDKINIKDIISDLKETKEGNYNFIYENVLLIGVTGMQSKTTISLIEHILKHAGLKTGVISSNCIKFYGESIHTTFNDLKVEMLQYVLNKMIKKGIQTVIMEVSSHTLDSNKMHDLKFDIAVHTSIENEYSGCYRNSGDFLKIQKELFHELDKDKIAIINIDDNNALKLIEGNSKALIVTYGLNNKASLTASSISIKDHINLVVCLQRSLTTIQGVDIDTLEFPITLKLLGEHNIYSVLASIAVALCLNINVEIIKKSLIWFNGIE